MRTMQLCSLSRGIEERIQVCQQRPQIDPYPTPIPPIILSWIDCDHIAEQRGSEKVAGV